MIKNNSNFIDWLHSHEIDLMSKILVYAKQNNYTKYTSTLLEAWRISIVGLTDSLALLLEEYPDSPPSFAPDDNYDDDPASAFGLLEAKRHRKRGVNFAMFISLFKYYQQSYQDLINEHKTLFDNPSFYSHYVLWFFNRVEIAYSIEWNGRSSENQIHDLAEQNIVMTNEKNLYLTIFDSSSIGMVLVNHDYSLENFNQVASDIIFDYKQASGSYYYSDENIETPDWLVGYCREYIETGTTEFEYRTYVDKQARIYNVQIDKMNDISEKFSGYVLSFAEITDMKLLNIQLNEAQRLSHTGSWNWEVGTDNATWSKEFFRIYGYDSSKKPNVSKIIDKIHPDDKEQHLKELDNSLVKGHFDSEYRILLNSGSNEVRYLHAVGKAIFDDNKKATNLYGTVIDITSKKLMEIEKERNFEETLFALARLVESRDTYTGGHSKRVATYSKIIAEDMGYSEEDCELIYRAGILHDIGKISTPDTILLKPGKLTSYEYKLIQNHVNVGESLLNKISMYGELADIMKYHHERYDGKGYPYGLKGDEIPPLARIMILADAFDAITTKRIYKHRDSLKGALREIKKHSKKQFDPVVVEHALKVLKDIDLDTSIDQEPTNSIERERFAYFYIDQLTHLHNKDYLELVMESINSKKFSYSCAYMFYLHEFSNFNNKYGWDSGNELLKKFAEELTFLFPSELLFRIHGDDFLVICSEEVDFPDDFQFTSLKKTDVNISHKYLSLLQDNPVDIMGLYN